MIERGNRARVVLVAILAAALFCACGSQSAVAAKKPRPNLCLKKHWVGAWGASPGAADPASSRSLAGMTSRTVLTPLRSGDQARVRLSNLFSDQPLTIDAASIAGSGTGAAIQARSRRSLTFGGKQSVTIPAGREVSSDPVAVEVKAFKRLSISLAVNPESAGVVTAHAVGRQTSYLATGAAASAASGSRFTETTLARLVVSRLDVKASRKVGTLVTFGDSITDGFQGDGSPATQNLTGVDQDARYPDFLAHRIAKQQVPLSLVNAGISGNRILQPGLLPRMGESGLTRLGRDVLKVPGVRSAIILEGINDIGQGPLATADQVIEGLGSMTRTLKSAGVRVFLGTLTPAGGTIIPTYGGTEANLIRESVNTWIRSQKLSQGIVDFDKALRDPGDPANLQAGYDSSDHLHPGTAGYQAMANAVPIKALVRPGCR